MAAGSESMAPEADTAEGYREHVAPLEESAAEAEAIDATSVENEAPATPQPEELPASFAPEAIDLTHLEASAAAEPIPQGGDEPSLEVAGTTEMVETGDSPAVTAGGEAGDIESSGNGGNITEINGTMPAAAKRK